MSDFDYWKRQYADKWGQSAAREQTIAAYLASASGTQIELVGFGAGSETLLPGAAATHGHVKGDADLLVVGTNIYLEVTGPLVASVRPQADLWVRPDKLNNARAAGKAKETWVVHHLPNGDLIRVLSLDLQFWRALDAGEFPVVTPYIRGAQERFHSIPPGHACVRPCAALIDRLIARQGE